MDYREIENRLGRNREMIKQREHDRLVEVIRKANMPQRKLWLVRLWAWFALSFNGYKARKAEIGSCVAVDRRTQLEHR